MQRALLIAEKPSLMRSIQTVYNKHKRDIPFEITFMCQSGHLFTLKNLDELDERLKKWDYATLPYYPDEHGGYKYKIAKSADPQYDNKKTFNGIKEEYNNGNYDFIIHAGDSDREGELLIWETLNALKINIPVKRYWQNALTEKATLDALMNLRDENEDFLRFLKIESYTRQHLDYIVGNNGTRAASIAMQSLASIGRVMSAILAMVCQREITIENFKPSTSYGVRVSYKEGFNGQYYVIPSESENAEEDEEEDKAEDKGLMYFDTKEEAQSFIDSLKGCSKATVVSFESKETKTKAPKLFKLATAQAEGGKDGYEASEIQDLINDLYLKAILSYPRTDCECMASTEDFEALIASTKACPALKPFADRITKADIERVKKTKKYVNDKELEEHGHSALAPTTNAPDWDKLSKDEKYVYEMICKRFLAIFMPPLVQNKTSLITDIDGNNFKSTGKTLVSLGYTEIFGTTFNDIVIPECSKGDEFSINGFDFAEKTTKCPPHFTTTSLVEACENVAKYLEDEGLKANIKNLHIGTSATRSGIIDKLIVQNHYLERKKMGKKTYVIPTKNGMILYNNIKDTIICKVDLTANWEILLDKVGHGQISQEECESLVKRDLEALIEQFKTTKMTALGGYETVGKCPKCGGDILSGKKGFFCKNWKKDGSGCDFSIYGFVCESKISDSEIKKLLSGQNIIKKIKNKGKSWEQELTLDKEEWKIAWVNKNADFVSKTTGVACPLCGKDIVTTPWGFKCEAYEKDNPSACKFSVGEICKVKLTEDDMADLVINKKTRLIDGFISQKGNKFSAYLCLNDDKGLKFEFPAQDENTSNVITKCPKCGSAMESSKWDYHCSNGCPVKLSKYVCKKWIPESELEKIFTKGKSGLIKGLQGKSKKFDAYLKWDKGESYEFDFPQKKGRR